MLTWQLIGTVLALNLGGILTPGPDMFLVLRLAARSRRHAIAAVLGANLGLFGWVLLTALGAAAVLARFPWLLGWIQLVGGLWLLFMAQAMVRSGLRELKERRHLSLDEFDVNVKQRLGTMGSAFRNGLITNISNPKIMLYFAAILAPVMPVGAPWWALAVIVFVVVTQAFLVFMGLALFISTDRMRRRLLSAGPYIDLAAGAFFTIAGVVLMFNGFTAVMG